MPMWCVRDVRMAARLAPFAMVAMLAAGAMTFPAQLASAQDSPDPTDTVRLMGERPAILSQATPGAPLGAGAMRTLAVVLAPSDPTGFAAFEQAVNDPASPSYQQYLTPGAWTAQFGPTPDVEAAVVAYLQQGGLSVQDEAPNLQVIRASGTTAQINQLFQLTLTTYSLPGNGSIVAPDQDPAVPTALAPAIAAIVGLSGNPTDGATPLVLQPQAQSGMKPVAPQDLQHAYQLDTLAAAGVNGTGETVAILATTPFSQADLDSYASLNKLAPFQLQTVSMPPSGTPPAANMEYTLDPSAVHAAAPGAMILMYELDCGEGVPACITLMLNRVVSDNRADIMTKSLDSCEPFLGQRDVMAREQIYATGAAQGITSFSASGDAGAYCTARFNNALMQASVHLYPSAVNVGGTSLTTGPQGRETAWSGSGGGESLYFPTPAYQTGPGTPTDGKEGGPDVAADGDFSSGLKFIFGGSPVNEGGTSLAAPVWAGVQAVVNQARGGSRRGQVLYDYYRRPQAFHAITAGSNGAYSAGPGWNFVTGLGTPNAPALAGR